MAKIGPRSYVVDVWAKQGTVLGGVKSTSSSYFARRDDAERWRDVTVQANREAGRDVESRIVASQHQAEIPASPDDDEDSDDGPLEFVVLSGDPGSARLIARIYAASVESAASMVQGGIADGRYPAESYAVQTGDDSDDETS